MSIICLAKVGGTEGKYPKRRGRGMCVQSGGGREIFGYVPLSKWEWVGEMRPY